MKRIILLLCVATMLSHYACPVKAEDTTSISKPKAEFSGFFRTDYWYDSRQVVEAIDGLLHLYPRPELLDDRGNDLNATPQFNGLALATRVRSIISMPEIFNAKASILIEVDFTGMHNMAHVRFRHGLASFAWESGTVLNIGQTWHPMFVTEVFPHVAGLNTGAPFQSFNRSPQITLRQPLGGNVRVILSALTQGDYKCFGPEGYSTIYLRRNLIPNVHAQLQLNTGSFIAGVAADYKGIKPLNFTQPTDSPDMYQTSELLHGLSGMAYTKVRAGLLTASVKGMLGQNLADHLMLGGYAVSSIEPSTGRQTYTPINHLFVHTNISFGHTYMPGLFVGYAKNLGTQDELSADAGTIYGRGTNIDQLYRISPNFTYRNNSFTLIGEVEYTVADIGTNSITNKAKVEETHSVANTRLQIVVQYDF